MCPTVMPTPSALVATPAQAPVAWLLLVGAACALGVVSPLFLRDFPAGRPRIVAGALLAAGALSILSGEFLLTNVSSAWLAALAAWRAAQSTALVARGCSLAPVDTADTVAFAAIGRLSAVGSALLLGSGVFYIALALLRTRWRNVA